MPAVIVVMVLSGECVWGATTFLRELEKSVKQAMSDLLCQRPILKILRILGRKYICLLFGLAHCCTLQEMLKMKWPNLQTDLYVSGTATQSFECYPQEKSKAASKKYNLPENGIM